MVTRGRRLNAQHDAPRSRGCVRARCGVHARGLWAGAHLWHGVDKLRSVVGQPSEAELGSNVLRQPQIWPRGRCSIFEALEMIKLTQDFLPANQLLVVLVTQGFRRSHVVAVLGGPFFCAHLIFVVQLFHVEHQLVHPSFVVRAVVAPAPAGSRNECKLLPAILYGDEWERPRWFACRCQRRAKAISDVWSATGTARQGGGRDGTSAFACRKRVPSSVRGRAVVHFRGSQTQRQERPWVFGAARG